MEDELDRWYKRLWETKGSRFIAANRLELHDRWSTVSMSLFSVYIISLNLFVLFPQFAEHPILNSTNITYYTICLSVLILVISLLVTSRSYKLRSERLHECGRRITNIYDKICLWKNTGYLPQEFEIEEINRDYSNILDKYENHRRIDFHLFQANNLRDYEKIKFKRLFWIKVKGLYYLETVLVYFFAIISPLLIIAIISRLNY